MKAFKFLLFFFFVCLLLPPVLTLFLSVIYKVTLDIYYLSW